ncbi:MAG: hypothetical protein Kow00105_08650 [Phycisphaeraceae bacterium]
MKIAKFVLPAIAAGFMATSAHAATFSITQDANNTVAGVTANRIDADGQGVDWTAIALKVDLTAGSVYNGAPDSNLPQDGFWAFFPDLEFDTWFGVPGDGTNGVAGGAGDLGGGPLNVSGTGVDAISITAFNTTTTDTGPVRIANVSLTDDAAGTWAIIVAFGDGTLLRDSGTVAGGALVPEPASLALMGLGGLAALRRRR